MMEDRAKKEQHDPFMDGCAAALYRYSVHEARQLILQMAVFVSPRLRIMY